MKTRNIKPVAVAERFLLPRAPRPNSRFQRIDRRNEPPKLQWFAPERKYALPPNIGNARNPIVFGKIPQEYADAERAENRAVNRNAQLANTNKAKYLERVRLMNYKHY